MTESSLTPGQRLGPYEITHALGEGGMGEVYKARDTRLNRTVAIKILRRALVSDPAGRARFEREARAISALDHPNICVLHDIGREAEREFLVMQFIEGETLAARLSRGPLPLDEALRYGTDIAAALDRAHRAGILHRDLKPGNIMLARSTGREPTAKLLDFGLAKLSAPLGAPALQGHAATVTSPITGQGAILGTLLYMSPEQLQGAEADVRSDIFSFGAVLYEMVTGARAFAGSSQASIIAAVLEREPASISTHVPPTPPALDRLVRKCLAKDPDRRWQSAADLRDELAWIAESRAGSHTSVETPRPATGGRALRSIAALLILGIVGALAWIGYTGLTARPQQAATPRLLNIALPADMRHSPGGVALSPDGMTLAYASAPASAADPQRPSTAVSKGRLYIRRLDSHESTAVPDSEGARAPFFSPDGNVVAFFTEKALKKFSLTDGSLTLIENVPPVTRGGAFLADGRIVLTPTQVSGLAVMAPTGGMATPLTQLDEKAGERAHMWPVVLPNGRLLYTIRRGTASNESDADLAIFDPATQKSRIVVERAAYGRYSPTGQLLFVRGRALMTADFTLATSQVSGAPRRIVDGIATHPWLGGGHFDVGPDGTVAFLRGSWGITKTQARWVDRSGKPLPGSPLSENELGKPRISPDGTRALFDGLSAQGDNEIFVADLAQGTTVRFTTDPEDDFDPIWTADGRRIIWTTLPSGKMPRLVWRNADGTGAPEPIADGGPAQFAGSVSRDGILAFAQWSGGRDCDIWVVPLTSDRKSRTFVVSPAHEFGPEFSPDGKWVAYVSDESGAPDVYVTPYPGPGGKRRVTTGGAAAVAWSRDGSELFYLSAEGFFAVEVLNRMELRLGSPKLLFKGNMATNSREDGPREYDVAEGAKRFLVIEVLSSGLAPPSLDVFSNWWRVSGSR
jgi:serine/threonine protein kinase/Tol biopolymer transport system component